MKKLTLVLTLFIFHFSFFTLKASTIINGPTASGHWTLVGSPYLIQNSVYIPNDSTLTIDPGVTVNFQTTFTPYMHVLGRLIAIGTAVDSIYFTATDTTDGFHGIRFYGIKYNNDTSKLEYCKIQYGKANGSNYYVENGGALLFDNWSKAIVSHCYISNCQANFYPNYGGGAIFCDSGSSPVITYNTITINQVTSTGGGGGIAIINGSTPVIAYNTIIGNSANGGGGIYILSVQDYAIAHNNIEYNSSGGGGGILMSSSKGTISNNVISNNYVPSGPGGGIYDANGDTLSVLNNTISYNTAANGNQGYGGGAIVCQSTNVATIADNIISNNSAFGSNGGGIYFIQAVSIIVSNNSITNNFTQNVSGTGFGGGICCNNTSPLLINNTIANNWAYDGGGLYCDLASNPESRNCIYWGDTATNSGNELFQNDQPSTPNYYYSDVQGGMAAFGLNGNFYYGIYANNINANPKFVSPSGGKGTSFDGVSADWSLTTGTSPCIDAGDPLISLYPSVDLLSNPRIVVCRIDMGAYENQYGISSPLQLHISGTSSLCMHDSTALTVTGSTTYVWSPTAGLSCTNCPNPIASPTTTTTYTVIGTSGVCEAMDTIVITVNPLPILTISNNLDTLKISGAKSYLWSTGSTNDTAIIHTNGTYYVTATDSNGCTAKDSIIMVSTSLTTVKNSSVVTVYPVPSNGNMNVILNGKGYTYMKILDELGREVYSQSIVTGNQNQNLRINLGNVANGIYILQVTSGTGVISKLLIIQK